MPEILEIKKPKPRKIKKITHHHIRNILLALILVVLVIFLLKNSSIYQKEPQNINITIENVNFDYNNILKNETQKNFLKPDKAFENIFCGAKYQDIRDLLINHTVKSWFVDSFSSIKLSPKEISYKDINLTLAIYLERSFDSRDFFIKTAFLKNNTNNEIIERLYC